MSQIILTDQCRSRHRCCSGSPTPTENPLARHQTLEEAFLDDLLETSLNVWSSPGVCFYVAPSLPRHNGGNFLLRAGPTGYPGLHLPCTARKPISLANLQDVFHIQYPRMDVDATERDASVFNSLGESESRFYSKFPTCADKRER